MGLASALASGGAMAQEQPAPSTPPAAVRESPASAPASEPSPSEPQFVLPTVKVEGETGPYNVQDSGLVRVPTPLLDTPQTVVVVPGAVIEQQRANTVRDALRNVSGITISAGEGGRQGDTFIIRGFSAQQDVFRDGIRDLGWFTRDTFNIQNVEVYFGPSALLFGRGSTGGAVNLVTRTPTSTTSGSVSIQGGTAPLGRLEGDVNVALTDAFQFRLDAMGSSRASRTGTRPAPTGPVSRPPSAGGWRSGPRWSSTTSTSTSATRPTTDTRTTRRRRVGTVTRSRTTSACPARPGTA